MKYIDTVEQGMNQQILDAIEKALDDIKNLSDDEFLAKLEKHKNGDIAIAINELTEFSNYLEK